MVLQEHHKAMVLPVKPVAVQVARVVVTLLDQVYLKHGKTQDLMSNMVLVKQNIVQEYNMLQRPLDMEKEAEVLLLVKTGVQQEQVVQE